jgi:hypothetical protein
VGREVCFSDWMCSSLSGFVSCAGRAGVCMKWYECTRANSTIFILLLLHTSSVISSAARRNHHCFILYNAVKLHTIVKNDRMPTGTTVNTKIS